MPYWAELWPSGLALARALPTDIAGLTVVELGCGLGVPSLVAAAHHAYVTAIDWAGDAIELLRENAARNGLDVRAVRADWRRFDEEEFSLALASDVLYEDRNVRPLLELLPRVADEVWLADPGRPHGASFLAQARKLWHVEEPADRVYRLIRGTPADLPARPGA